MNHSATSGKCNFDIVDLKIDENCCKQTLASLP